MSGKGYSTSPATTPPTPETTVTKALIDKLQQIERRISAFIDDSAGLQDVNTDTTLKETERSV
jgi:hypothetical protein